MEDTTTSGGFGDGGDGRAEPAWYADPDDGSRIRWWDGSAWTDHVRPLVDEWSPDPEAVGTVGPVPAPVTSTRAAETDRRVPLPLKVLGAVVLVAVLVGGALVATGTLRSDDPGSEPGSDAVVEPAAATAELFLEPVGAVGPEVFTPALGTRPSFVPQPVETTAKAERPTGGGVLAVASDMPGLYGGTGSETCDPQALLDHLHGAPQKRAAFADVLDVDVDDLDAYVERLVPLLLSRDTRVTNHGYVDGEAEPRQSVLEAGTAVLVDGLGVPRVRCECGNPLSEPQALDDHEVVGTAWPGYEAAEAITVTPASAPLGAIKVQTPDGLSEVRLTPLPADFLRRTDVLATMGEVCGDPGIVATFDADGRWSAEGVGSPTVHGARIESDHTDVNGDGYLDAVFLYTEYCGAAGRPSARLGVVLADPSNDAGGVGERLWLAQSGQLLGLGHAELRAVGPGPNASLAYMGDDHEIPFTVELALDSRTFTISAIDGYIPFTPENAVRGFLDALVKPGMPGLGMYAGPEITRDDLGQVVADLGLAPGRPFPIDDGDCRDNQFGPQEYSCLVRGPEQSFSIDVRSAFGVEGLDGYRVSGVQTVGGM